MTPLCTQPEPHRQSSRPNNFPSLTTRARLVRILLTDHRGHYWLARARPQARRDPPGSFSNRSQSAAVPQSRASSGRPAHFEPLPEAALMHSNGTLCVRARFGWRNGSRARGGCLPSARSCGTRFACFFFVAKGKAVDCRSVWLCFFLELAGRGGFG